MIIILLIIFANPEKIRHDYKISCFSQDKKRNVIWKRMMWSYGPHSSAYAYLIVNFIVPTNNFGFTSIIKHIYSRRNE